MVHFSGRGSPSGQSGVRVGGQGVILVEDIVVDGECNRQPLNLPYCERE